MKELPLQIPESVTWITLGLNRKSCGEQRPSYASYAAKLRFWFVDGEGYIPWRFDAGKVWLYLLIGGLRHGKWSGLTMLRLTTKPPTVCQGRDLK